MGLKPDPMASRGGKASYILSPQFGARLLLMSVFVSSLWDQAVWFQCLWLYKWGSSVPLQRFALPQKRQTKRGNLSQSYTVNWILAQITVASSLSLNLTAPHPTILKIGSLSLDSKIFMKPLLWMRHPGLYWRCIYDKLLDLASWRLQARVQ